MTLINYLLKIRIQDSNLQFILIPQYEPPIKGATQEEMMQFIEVQQAAYLNPIPVLPQRNAQVLDAFFPKYKAFLDNNLVSANTTFEEYIEKYLFFHISVARVEITQVQIDSRAARKMIDVAEIK